MEDGLKEVEENAGDTDAKEKIKNLKEKFKNGAQGCRKGQKKLEAGKLCYLVSG